MSFCTVLTLGALQAAVPASSFSPHDRTLPDSVTVPPLAPISRQESTRVLFLTTAADIHQHLRMCG